MAKTPPKKADQIIPEVDEDRFKSAVSRLLSTPPKHKTAKGVTKSKRRRAE